MPLRLPTTELRAEGPHLPTMVAQGRLLRFGELGHGRDRWRMEVADHIAFQASVPRFCPGSPNRAPSAPGRTWTCATGAGGPFDTSRPSVSFDRVHLSRTSRPGHSSCLSGTADWIAISKRGSGSRGATRHPGFVACPTESGT
jgi:hypothetical protein